MWRRDFFKFLGVAAATMGAQARGITLSGPGSLTARQGQSASATLQLTNKGKAEVATFSVSGLPSGVSAAFLPASCKGGCQTVLTVKAASNATTGNYNVIVRAQSRSYLATMTMMINIAPSLPIPSGPVYPEGQLITSQPSVISLSRPDYLAWSAIPGLDTSVMRVTDQATFGGSRRYYLHYYAKQQAWNCDSSKIVLAMDTSPAYFIHGQTYAYQSTTTELPETQKWSATDPDKLYGCRSRVLSYYRPSTNTRTTLHDFSGEFTTAFIGVGEGNPDNNDAFMPIVCNQANANPVIVLWDVTANEEIRRATLTGIGPLDWAGMSQSGDYFITLSGSGVRLYDSSDLSFIRTMTAGTGHSDLGYDFAGNEVYVSGTFIGGEGVRISTTRLSDNTVTQQLRAVGQTGVYMASNYHISCRAIDRPGYAYISTYDFGAATDAFMFNEVYALKLDGSGTVERFSQGFFSASPADLAYQRAAKVTPNRDGSLVLFSSDWNDPDSDTIIYDYIAGVQ